MAEGIELEIQQEQARRQLLRQLNVEIASRQPEPTPPPTMLEATGNAVREFNTGAIEMLPAGNIQNELAKIGAVNPVGQQPEGALGTGMRFAGNSALFAPVAAEFGVFNAGQRLAQQGGGIIKTILQNITADAAKIPVRTAAVETASGFGAGVAMGGVDEDSLGGAGQGLAALAGGLSVGAAIETLPNTARSFYQSLKKNLLPMFPEGASIRASEMLQTAAGGSINAARLAELIEQGVPEGMTPARFLENIELMAKEGRLLTDNKELALQVQTSLDEALKVAGVDFSLIAGKPRSQAEWEQSLIQNIAPDGTTIAIADTDTMLNQAYNGFSKVYDPAKGVEIELPSRQVEQPPTRVGSTDNLSQPPPKTEIIFESNILNAINDPVLLGDAESVGIASRWVQNQLKGFDIESGSISSDDLLTLRSRMRAVGRRFSKDSKSVMRDIFKAAESEVTLLLQKGLPEDALASLNAADLQYRTYNIVDNAIYSAGDEVLTPEILSNAIRSGGLTTNSRYARAVDRQTQVLRQFALEGRDPLAFAGDSRRAAFVTRGMDDEGKQAVRSSFITALYNNVTSEGTTNGAKLLSSLKENVEVMRVLGTSDEIIENMMGIARTIERANRTAPAPSAQLFEDAPATILQLAAALVGAQSGQNLADGVGSSMVMAQFMSRRARNFLNSMTGNQATKLLTDASTDPELYAALLTRSNVPEAELKFSTKTFDNWLLALTSSEIQQQQQEQEQQ
tara:strand:+ start:993 stop:3206 length:2214 start_codon:yes stop_codon:yes gene_type:complete